MWWRARQFFKEHLHTIGDDMMKWLAAVLGLAMLTGCGTTSVGLKYAPTEGSAPSRVAASVQPVTVGAFVDKRNEKPTWLGAIRGGFGNPLKTLESSQPVAEVVQAAYVDAFKASGIAINPAAALQITGTILDLKCTQMSHKEATVAIEVTVSEKSSGLKRFTQTYSSKYVSGFIPVGGVLAPVEDLRIVLENTMRDVINKTLADASFIAALTQAKPSQVGSNTVTK